MRWKQQAIKLLGGLLVASMVTGVATANPVSLGSFTHDYGSAPGKYLPTSAGSNSCDTVNADSVTVRTGGWLSGCDRFNDAFDLTGLGGANINRFDLTLTYAGAADETFLFFFDEHWYVRPASGNGHGSNQTNSGLNNAGTMWFLFDDTLDVFQDIVDSGSFHLWFAENSMVPNPEFTLDSATLEVFGSTEGPSVPDPVDVPEPGSLALTGLGALLLLGLAWRRRRQSVR